MPFTTVFPHIFTLWTAIAGGVFVVVTGLVLFAVVHNRARRREHLPFGESSNNVVEGAFAVLLGAGATALIVGSFFAISQEHEGEGLAADTAIAPANRITVTGFRWCWDFAYPGAAVRVTGDCATARYPVLVVPAGQPVELSITSRDVAHAFWIPDLDAKRDAYPGHDNHLRMVFPPGRWRGRCSEFCGNYHTTMDFWVQTVSPEQYQQFLAGGAVAGATA